MQNGAGSVQSEFISILDDVSDFLRQHQELQKKNSIRTNIIISEESEAIMDAWSRKKSPEVPFFFEGPDSADIFILDSSSDFFNGKSGDLLTKILAAMKVKPDTIFICDSNDLNSVHEKISQISPKVIITLGSKASRLLLEKPLEKVQGVFHEYSGIKVMPTFHPAFLLKHAEYKRPVWEAMKKVMDFMGIKP